MLFPQVSGNARPTCSRLPRDACHSRLQLHVVSSSEQVLVREGKGSRSRLMEASLAAAAGGNGQPHHPPVTVRARKRDREQLLANRLATAALALKHT